MPSITVSHGSANIVPRTDSVQYIVCHYTAGGEPDDGALGNLNYFKGGSGGRAASAHYIIDNTHIYEYADPASSCCWHCGDGHGQYGITNQNSVGIEVALTGDVPYSEQEIQNLTWLVNKLMTQFHVSADHVVRHYDASRKACPLYYTPSGQGGDSAWQELHKQITGGSNSTFSGNDGTSGSGSSSGGTYITDPAIAYALGIQGKILFSQEEVYPYVITIDAQTPDLDADKLKENDVVGVCIDMGSYFTASHTVNRVFRSPKLDEQYDKFYSANMAVGLYTTIRARNEDEVLDELKEIRLTVLKYPPNMGLWLVPVFVSSNKSTNDKLIDAYYKALYKLGFNDQVGFYCKKDQMEKFDWENYQEDWYWWLDRHISDVSKIHNMPTPKFFMYDDPGDEDSLVEPDFSYTLNMLAGGGGTGSNSSASSNDGADASASNETEDQASASAADSESSSQNSTDDLSSKQRQDILSAARTTRGTGRMNDLTWVRAVMQHANIPSSHSYTDARAAYNGLVTSKDHADLKPGMIVACLSSRTLGHIGIYMGNDTVRYYSKSVLQDSLNAWSRTYARYKPVGWGWWK